jgi:hypothetical protein
MGVNDNSRMVIDKPTVMLKIVASLNDNSGGIICDHNMVIAQASGGRHWPLIFPNIEFLETLGTEYSSSPFMNVIRTFVAYFLQTSYDTSS